MKNKGVTTKQKQLLKKLGCLTWDKARTLQEASQMITGYLSIAARSQMTNDNSTYSKGKKQSWEKLWGNRQPATWKQRKALQQLGYDYWNSPYLTWKEAQEWCAKFWKMK